MLWKRNREIAEVRDEVQKAEKRLDELQAKNQGLLEETAKLDTEVSRHSTRAAASEMRVAQFMDAARSREQRAAEQKAAQDDAMAAFDLEAKAHSDERERLEAELSSYRTRMEELTSDLERHRSCQEAWDDDLVAVRKMREDLRGKGQEESGAVLEAKRALEQRLQDLESECKAEADAEDVARSRCAAFEEENQVERSRCDTLNQSLREAVSEQAESKVRVQRLEASLAERGGDPASVLAGARGGSAGGGASDAEVKYMEQLRSELRTAEEQCEGSKASIQRSRANTKEATDRLQLKLDIARDDLQRSLKLAAETHGATVANMESEVQAQKQLVASEVRSEMACAEAIARLTDKRKRLRAQQGEASANAGAQAGQCEEAQAKMRQVRASIALAEDRTAAMVRQTEQAEAKRKEVERDSADRIAKGRLKLQELWKALRVQSVKAGLR